MARVLNDVAYKFSNGRIAFLLEGGYDLTALRKSTAAVLAALQSDHSSLGERLHLAESRIEPIVRRVLQVHEKYQ